MGNITGPAKTQVNIIPNLHYRNCDRAIDFLTRAFGFEQREIYRDAKGKVVHAQLTFGNGMIMISPVSDTDFQKYMNQPDENGGRETQCSFVIVADPKAHYERAKAEGAKILMEPSEKDYGGTDYSCHDIEGHLWSFGSYDPWK
ncbi:MAG: glyoxalase [Proteobacteria bacterium]|nr:MAG: glyoxalase [Pseudomonadota bacterium]